MLEESKGEHMNLIIENAFKGIKLAVLIGVVLFIVIGAVCAYNAYGDTWTIENNQFKEVYDDYDDCMRNNLGTGTTDKCNDDSQVIYKNK